MRRRLPDGPEDNGGSSPGRPEKAHDDGGSDTTTMTGSGKDNHGYPMSLSKEEDLRREEDDNDDGYSGGFRLHVRELLLQ